MLKVNAAELAKLQQRLQAITEKVAKRALRTAARRAMLPVRDEVRANAPFDPDGGDDIHIRSNVAVSSRYRNGDLLVRVGIRGGARKNPDTPYYWRMVEFGTKHIPARPFMAPALESNAEDVLATLTEELNRALDKA